MRVKRICIFLQPVCAPKHRCDVEKILDPNSQSKGMGRRQKIVEMVRVACILRKG